MADTGQASIYGHFNVVEILYFLKIRRSSNHREQYENFWVIVFQRTLFKAKAFMWGLDTLWPHC